jgi:hypothetical protein
LFCPYCDEKDWKPTPPVAPKVVKQGLKQWIDGVGCIAGLVVRLIVGFAFLLGGLWLFVAIVKWMWGNS